MNKKIAPFLAGMATTVLLVSVTVSALAATGRMSIEIDPVNIKVNNEIFRPKDVNGNDVLVFAYNGTTYAPLRALAEAYGLQVGWDQASGTATVVDPDAVQPTPAPDTPSSNYASWTAEEKAAYREFRSMWSYTRADNNGNSIYTYVGIQQDDVFISSIKQKEYQYWYKFIIRFADDEGVPIKLYANEKPIFMATKFAVVYDVVYGKGVQTDGVPLT